MLALSWDRGWLTRGSAIYESLFIFALSGEVLYCGIWCESMSDMLLKLFVEAAPGIIREKFRVCPNGEVVIGMLGLCVFSGTGTLSSLLGESVQELYS